MRPPRPHSTPKGGFRLAALTAAGFPVYAGRAVVRWTKCVGWPFSWLNGAKVIDTSIQSAEVQKILRGSRSKKGEAELPLLEESPISLQNHSSEVWFRNIKIRVLE